MPRKLTTESVNQRLAPFNIKLNGDWKGTRSSHSFTCLIHNESWTVKDPREALTGITGCTKCFEHKLSQEEVQLRLKSIGVQLKGKWRGGKHKHIFVCNEGHEWEALGQNPVFYGTGCPICNSPIPDSLVEEDAQRRISQLGISLISPWNGTASYHRFRCQLGHEWETRASAILYNKRGCPECVRLRRKNRNSAIVS